ELEERLVLKGKDIIIGSDKGKAAGLADDGRILLDSGGKINKISHGSPVVIKPISGPSENIIAIDIGNTSARIGYADKTGVVKACDVPISPEKDFSARLISAGGELIAGRETPAGAAVSCVSDRVRKKVMGKLKKSYKVKVTEVSRKNCAGLKLKIKPETAVGADRLANAVAVRDYYGGPAVVVDLGTANTFDIIDREGAYLGGVIAPGVESMKDVLVEQADKLSDFEITAPETVIGTDTESCMRSGFYFTLTGQINEVLSRLRKERGTDQKIIFTGGWVSILGKEYLQNYIVDRNLTLKGIMLIAARKQFLTNL
ncbi:MAG: type III pantothenate kinase, partial [Elusimicrobiota bacterium]|nr:type III pantothenate kinase [Elusimicrobiota bacterium]